MKKLKKQIVLFAVAVFVMLMTPSLMLSASAEEGEIASGNNGLEWVIDANGKLTVSGNGDYWLWGNDASYNPWYNYRVEIKSAVVNVTGMKNAAYLFYDCPNLVSVDLSHFDTSNATRMDDMFSGCCSLKSVDLSGFDTSKVTDMDSMFEGCSSLTNLDLSHFNTSSVTSMWDMFKGCSSLTSLDLSNFDTSKVTDMDSMFDNCSSLKDVNLSSFNTSNVEMMDFMFRDCRNLKSLDLSHFNTSKLTDISNMFLRCSNLTSLNLSSFDLSKVVMEGIEDWDAVFGDCDNLVVIYTPYNFKPNVGLPGKGWQLPDGTKITQLPQNLNYSVMLTRKSIGTVEDNNGNNNEKPDTPDKDDNNQHWNNGSGNDQTGATSGVLEGTGNSTDSAIYGKKLLTAKATDFKTILLSWDAAPNAKSYEIFYSTSPSGGFKRLANVKKTSYKFSKAKCGVTYYFQMRVCEKKSKSEFGPVSYAKTALTGSTTLQVKKSTYNSVQLKWNKVPGAKKYEIFYADSMGGSWQSLGIKGGTSFTHKKLVTGATYYYQVRPVRDTFRGSWSNGVSATTALGDVVGLKVKAAGSDRMKLSWKKVRGATQYVILRADSIDGTYETIGHSGKASYMDTGLSGGTTYFYKVYAVSGPYRTKETAPVGQTTKIPKK